MLCSRPPVFVYFSYIPPLVSTPAPRDRNNVGPRLQRRAEDGSEPSSRSFRGAPGGNRGPRGGFRGRGRQYDRHSATGIVYASAVSVKKNASLCA